MHPMERFEYMKIKYSIIPEEIILQYGLSDLDEPDGYVYVEI